MVKNGVESLQLGGRGRGSLREESVLHYYSRKIRGRKERNGKQPTIGLEESIEAVERG